MEQFGDDLDTMQIQINIGAYECRICDNNFTSPIQLTVHYIILHGLLPCIHCMKLFENKQLLADHNEKYHTTHNYICPECLMNFPDDEQLFSHIFHIHSMKLCTFCEQPCPIDEYSQHIAMKHNVNEPTAMKIIIASDNQTEFICQLCHDNKPVNRLDKLFSHYLYFHKCILKSLLCCILKYNSIESMKFLGIDDNIHVKCFTCNLPYTWNIPKNYHKIYCQGYSCCTACNICFDSREKFNQHSKECQNLQSTIDFCDSCLLNGSIDESHVQSIHNISTVNKIWTNDSSLLNENNSCNFCTINFASQSVTLNEIIEHFRIVHKFNSIAILRLLKHRKNEIKTEETNDLTESGHQIMNQNNKRIRENIAEILTIDSDNVEYVMSFDTKMVKFLYSSASDYDSSDLEDEAPKSINIFQCDLCNTRFKSKFVYAKHMQETHGFTVNAFEFRCNVCKRKLASQRSLKKHNQNCHHKRTEQHRFKCQFCDFKCNKKGKIRYAFTLNNFKELKLFMLFSVFIIENILVNTLKYHIIHVTQNQLDSIVNIVILLFGPRSN